jgi:hypothetical protein
MKSTYKAVEQDLAQFAIEAHGGLDRWKRQWFSVAPTAEPKALANSFLASLSSS